MKIANKTKNTIYLEDVDLHLPYKNGESEEVLPDILKKSKCLRAFILDGTLDVIEYDENERVESSIMYMKNKISASKPSPIQEEEPIEIPEGKEIEVKMHGIFYDAGGYGKVNRNFASNLNKLGVKIKIEPKRSVNQLKEDELKPIAALEKTEISKKHIRIDSVVPTFAEASSGKYKILYTTIESYTIPKQFLECCQLYNEIWLTSPWAAEVLKEHIKDKPIYVVPAGVDETLYTMSGPAFDFRPNVKKFVFVSVFGWGYRKGYDVLLKAYFDEFSSDDDVSLILMSRYQGGTSKFHRTKIKDDIDKIMEGFPNKNLPHVVRYSDILPEADMPKLYRGANCFVLPSRGEGSNLCAVEAALCGLPVIMTNVSGQQMYLRQDNALLIEMDHLVEISRGQMHVHYWDGQKFPSLVSPSVHNQMKQAMRFAYESYLHDGYRDPKQRNERMRKLILDNYTWKKSAIIAKRRLQEIRNSLKD